MSNLSKAKTTPPIAWTIAGSDSGGGAGIQADLKTFFDFGVHGCSVITAITAQNTLGIYSSTASSEDCVNAQISALAQDLPAAAIKLGMLADETIVKVLSSFLKTYQGLVICDPIFIASSGTALLTTQGRAALIDIFPRVDLLTPNLPEAESLLGRTIDGAWAMAQAAKDLRGLGAKAVLLTGGHSDFSQEHCVDYFTDGENGFFLRAARIKTLHGHGSGCTLSAAITALCAAGFRLIDAVVVSKAYITQGFRQAVTQGQGPAPVMQAGWPEDIRDFPQVSPDRVKLPSFTFRPFTFQSCESLNLGLYPVVDSVAWIEKLLPLGVKTIQLRIKNKDTDYLHQQISKAVKIAEKYQAALFINDHWRLAIQYKAYGVHLGQEDLEDADLAAIADAQLRLGVSTHSYWGIARAHALVPSYIAIGPIFDTTTKKMRFAQQGIEKLRTWVKLLGATYPLVAIGGIDTDRAKAVLHSGVGSIAMVSAITQADDYVDTVGRLIKLIDDTLLSLHKMEQQNKESQKMICSQ